MGQTVYVVTNPENGWDCVTGVFSSLEEAEKWEKESEMYIVHEVYLDGNKFRK